MGGMGVRLPVDPMCRRSTGAPAPLKVSLRLQRADVSMSQWEALPRCGRGDGRRAVERPFIVVAIIFLGVLTRRRSIAAARLSCVTPDLLCCVERCYRLALRLALC